MGEKERGVQSHRPLPLSLARGIRGALASGGLASLRLCSTRSQTQCRPHLRRSRTEEGALARAGAEDAAPAAASSRSA